MVCLLFSAQCRPAARSGGQEAGGMGFPGTWMTESESVVYRVVPKCACSTIGQIMYYSDHGRFFDGDIHDSTTGLHKWSQEASAPLIEANVKAHRAYTFTCVRNPYTRILSSFFDKICGIQRNGKRYRGNLVPLIMQKYGVSTFIVNGGRYDHIVWTEDFNPGMQVVLDHIDTPVKVDLAAIPRFNESEGHGPRRAHPVEDYFDDLSMHLVKEIYNRDFQLFRYDFDDPSNKMPKGQIDLDEVHAKLSQ
jgi:hypothetical protein